MRTSTSVLVLLCIGGLAFVAGAASAAKEESAAPRALVPHRLDLDVVPMLRALGASDDLGATYAFIDAAGIAGVDTASGGPAAANFVHLEDPLVCGALCRINSTSFGDETYTGICPPANEPDWAWHWSSGFTSAGKGACATLADSVLYLHANGFIQVAGATTCSGSGCYTPTNVPATAGPNAAVYGLWADLDNSCTTGTSGFYLGVAGDAPERALILEWWNVPTYPCSATKPGVKMEIILFEADNSVEVYYGAAGTFTSTYTAGEDNSAGNAGLQYARASTAAAPPADRAIVYFDAHAPVVDAVTLACGTAGSGGWCRSATNTLTIRDSNDQGPNGRQGMGIASRTRTIGGGASAPYTNNTAASVTLADGIHDIVATAKDWGLNSGTRTATLKIDTVAPTFAARADVVAEATSASGAVVFYDAPVASDATSGAGPVSCAPVSGSQFALGQTSVTCTASDLAGNGPASTSFVVRVVDTTAPVIDPRSDVTAEATGPNGAAVTFSAPASHDLVSGDGTATCSPASGSTFALGDTTITCSASDAAGNTGSRTFQVHVVDTTPPAIDGRADITAEATSAAGASVPYTSPASHDLVSGAGTASCSPASGSTFALGTTSVTCSATDAAGNTGSSVFHVSVVDTTPPAIAAHGNELEEATGPAGAAVVYTAPTWSDAVDGSGSASCAPASGSTFAVGDTTVTCHAADSRGNAATPTTFLVRVRDTTPPTIAARADVEAEASGLAGALAYYAAPATSDIVDGAGVATCAPASGSLFAVGETTVTCQAVDAAGNAATPTHFVVRVTLRISVHVQIERSFYDVRDALSEGVHAIVSVRAGDGSPLAGAEVRIRVTRVLPAIGAFDNATLVATTDASGEARFELPAQFALAGDYVVEAATITPGLEGSDTASYSVGVGSLTLAVDRRSI